MTSTNLAPASLCRRTGCMHHVKTPRRMDSKFFRRTRRVGQLDAAIRPNIRSVSDSNPALTVEMAAKAWHALSDHALDGVPLNGNGCNCRYYAPWAKKVVDLFTGVPQPEPDGLGAVVVNPLSDQVWVRSAHPVLPWRDPPVDVVGDWADPTSGDWSTWDALPRPLVVQSTGWKVPPSPLPPRRFPAEPTGLGAVVVDKADGLWVRLYDGHRPWVKAEASGGQALNWADLDQPVRVCSHGWTRS